MDLQQLLGGSLRQEATQLISQQLGLDESQAQNAVNLALPTLLNALNKNASTEQGAAALSNAISNDHNGIGLSDLAGLAQNALGGQGASILQHILGGSQNNVTNAIAQNSGIGGGQASQVLQILAPIVLNALGNQSQQSGGGINIGNIAGILSNFVGNQQQQAPQNQNIITSLLDRDKDGSAVDDVLGMLGGLFKK